MQLVKLGDTWVNLDAVVKVGPPTQAHNMCARSVITLRDGIIVNCGEDAAYVAELLNDAARAYDIVIKGEDADAGNLLNGVA